ncbi:hypothetical protein ACTU45_33125 [Streptomyces sp. 24-1644]
MSSTCRLVLYRWLQLCVVRDEHRRPAKFTLTSGVVLWASE